LRRGALQFVLLLTLLLEMGCANGRCPPPPDLAAPPSATFELAETGAVATATPVEGDGESAVEEDALAGVRTGEDLEPQDGADDFYDWLEETEDEGPDPADRDAIEPVNRPVFGFNEIVYRWVFDPIAKTYAFVVPEPARAAVRRVFANLNEPAILVNDLLQLAPREAGHTAARFVVNTTIGLVGLFDPATPLGLPGHETDFGQTLAVYYTPPGTYVVIPILGPSTARDAVGGMVDFLMSPDAWLLPAGSRVMLNAGSGLATYDIQRERLDALRETSIDFYSALRGAYLMDRDAAVQERIERVRCPAPVEPAPAKLPDDPLLP